MTLRRLRRHTHQSADIAPLLDRIDRAEEAQKQAATSIREALTDVRRALDEIEPGEEGTSGGIRTD